MMIRKKRKYMSVVLIFVMVIGSFSVSAKVGAAEIDSPTEVSGQNTEPVTETESTTVEPTTTEQKQETVVTESATTATTEKKQEKTTEKKSKKKETKNEKNKKTTEKTTEEATAAISEEIIPGAERPENTVSNADVQKAVTDAAEAEKKRQEAQNILDRLEEAKNNIEEYVTQLDQSLNNIQLEIVELEENQKILEKSIIQTQEQLTAAKQAEQEQYDAMKIRIQMVYEAGQTRYLDVLLNATSMIDMLNKTEYVSQISFYDFNVLSQLKETKERVANLKLKLDNDLQANETLQIEVGKQKEMLETLMVEKSIQMAEYQQSIQGQEEEVEKYTRAKEEAEAIIASAEITASRSYTSTYTGGEFLWPVPGYNQITSYFGGRNAPIAGASSYHKGIDIACDSGASVVAAASGTVIVATYNYAEGNYVCIDHGGGVVTLYMHNSSLLVSVGDSVSAGDAIALAGSTGVSTGPHCHFGVRVDGEYVDPLSYLQ